MPSTSKHLYKYLLLFSIALFYLPVYAITGVVPLETLTIADGLAGETVNKVITDHSGRIWIATNNGVNVFNGRKLVTFNLSDAHHTTVAVSDLCETEDKSIYAATEYGLYRMVYGGDDFQHILPEVDHPISLLADGKYIYIGGQQGFQVYDGKNLKTVNVGASHQGLDNIVRMYVKGDDGLIWFASRYDINTYNPETGKITRHSLKGIMPEKIALSQFVIVGDDFYLGTSFHGLYVYNIRTGQCEKMSKVGNIIKTVRKSSDGYVCVGTDGTGAFLIDPKSKQIVETFDMQEPYLLPTNAVYSFYRDDNGINWFGFVRYGLAYTSHVGQLFKPLQLKSFSTLGLNVRTFCLRDNECLIGTQNGFWYFNSTRNFSKYFSPEEFGGGHIVNNICWYQGKYYIGTYDGGLRVLDPVSMTLQKYKLAPALDNTTIGDIKVGPDSCLWIGSGEGLFIFSPNGIVRRYTEQNSHIQSGHISNITFDAEGNAWLTGASGISLFSAASGEIVDVTFPDDFFYNVPYLFGTRGHDGIIYMRNGPQLFYTTTDLSSYGEIKLPIVLSDKWCRSIQDDMNGRLWISSEKGLFSFDYNMKGMLHFGEGEGLRGRQISEISQDVNGKIWVCTSEGIFYMDPKDLDSWRQNNKYKVTLYNIRKGSDLLPITASLMVNEERRIRLTWNFGSEVLQAEAVLQDYARQRGRLYEYRLDNREWQVIQDGEPIYIHGLWIGTHRLSVRLVDMEGTKTDYSIVVLPSLGAIIELVLLIGFLLLLYFIYRYRKNTNVLLSERNDIEDALIEVEHTLNQVIDGDESEKNKIVIREHDKHDSKQLSASNLSKYQRVKLDEKECEDIVNRMKRHIEEGKVYTDADLKMKHLADVLHISPSKLSQIFSLYMKENYYDFINKYRLDEFKRLLDAGEYKRYTITALSRQSGFKKSNFFSTFRKVEGMTPMEYLKKNGIKVMNKEDQ